MAHPWSSIVCDTWSDWSRVFSIWGVLRTGDTKYGKKTFGLSFLCVHLYSIVQFLRKIESNQWTVCTLLISFDRPLIQNIKSSVSRILNSLPTDVFIFCIKHLLNNIKMVQTVYYHLYCLLSLFFFHNWILRDIQQLNYVQMSPLVSPVSNPTKSCS